MTVKLLTLEVVAARSDKARLDPHGETRPDVGVETVANHHDALPIARVTLRRTRPATESIHDASFVLLEGVVIEGWPWG